jgi:hypothetical protein
MKKAFLIYSTLLILVVITACKSGKLTAVRSTNEDYNKAIKSIVYCSCLPFKSFNFSPTDSLRIDSMLRNLINSEKNDFDFELFWNKVILSYDNTHIVEYEYKIKDSSNHSSIHRIAFFDTLFRPLGLIVGNRLVHNCCANYLATVDWKNDELPTLHLFRWGYGVSLPVEIGKYAPKNFYIEAYRFNLGGWLYVRGHKIANGIHKEDTVFMRLKIKQ